ncbi:MAG: hypothetical protein AAGU21_10285 [Solidesulfovibrio sp.]|uniref:hypothetical protein n=1 Tax=Desulfovibrionaceae TaxID=194924 RepID=UPI001FAD651F|nr:hypothetical protein [Fundidesulfovibrio agrisoli]
MKIFLSSLSIPVIKRLHKINPNLKPNVLVTFYGLQRPRDYTITYRSMINELILDCGAFSINNDKKLSVQSRLIESDKLFFKYRDYTKIAQGRYDFLFSFDDDFTPNGFTHNLTRLMRLEADNIKAVPVIHNLHNNEIEFFIKSRPKYQLVAIGQCQGDNRNDLRVLFNAVDSLYRNGIRVHLFGMTTPSLISHVPAYSSDSKAWVDYATRGRALYHNTESGFLDKEELIYFPNKQNFGDPGNAVYYKEYRHMEAFLAHIKSKLDLELEDLIAAQTQAMSLSLVNVLYFMELEERITEENRLLGITFP